jgi:hypothetical protein
MMKERGFTIPEIMLIGGTRVALGAGIGLLISGGSTKINERVQDGRY